MTSPGNAQGTVGTATYTDSDTGTTTTFHQFQPTPGEAYGDLWATTPASSSYIVNYTDANGSAQSPTCPTGCLLFYPGGPTTHRTPHLAGVGAWDTTITGIYWPRSTASRARCRRLRKNGGRLQRAVGAPTSCQIGPMPHRPDRPR